MPTRNQILRMLIGGEAYPEIGRVLGISPGQAYLIATGLPADGTDSFGEPGRPGVVEASPQHLVHGGTDSKNPEAQVHRWTKERARADLAMQDAAGSRSLGPGEPRHPEETDVATVLTRDHDQVTAMLKQLKTIPRSSGDGSAADRSHRKALADMISEALSKHESAEAQHFWPVIKRVVPDGGEMANQGLGQEQEGRDILRALDAAAASDEKFDQLVQQLDKAARKHVAYEDRLLLQLASALGIEERRSLGRHILEEKEHFPREQRLAPTEEDAS